MEETVIGRRDFLTRIIHIVMGLWGITAAAGVGYTGFRFLWPSKEMGTDTASSEKLEIPLTEMPKGNMLKVKYRGTPIGIIENNGKYHAVSIVCTHLGCIVTYDPNASDNLFCPCHASLFDLSGNVLDGPAPKPLQTYPVQLANDKLVIG